MVKTNAETPEVYDVETHVPVQPPPEFWIKDLGLTLADREILVNGKWFTDNLINAGQKMLKLQFGDVIQGLQSVNLAQILAMDVQSGEFVQILNGCGNHWFTISTVDSLQRTTVKVFDSANMFVSFRNKEEIAALLCTTEKSITLQFMNVHRQVGSNDCGLYSLAYATALCNGMDPTACIFDQEEMRPHFFKCIMGSRVLTPFPILKQRRASPKPKKVEAISIYCHCRLPHKPEEPMIQCGHCKEWYHDTCEKVEEECWNSRSKAKWLCRICR